MFLIDTLYPEYSSYLPKLNSILDPIIQKIGKELGAKYVYVNPIGRQGEFLEKYYDYHLNLQSSPMKSCHEIYDSFDNLNNYYKKLY